MTSSDYSIWTGGLVASLERFGPEAAAALRYIRQHGTRLSVHDQPTGARWTVDRRIEIHPRFAELAPDDPYAVSLIIHEVRHLQQGILTALSVYGELEAWQLQFGFLRSRTGRYHADAQRTALLERLMLLRLGWDRETLQRPRSHAGLCGQAVTRGSAPLYPLPAEIVYLAFRKEPARKS